MPARGATLSLIMALGLILSLVPVADVSAASHYRGSAASDYEDCCGIDLSYVDAVLYYYDDGSSIWGGHDPYNFCGHYWDGWRNNWCNAQYSPYGPTSMWINTEGQFEWIQGRYRHYHKAEFDANPGYWNYWCSQSGGTVPGGKWRCFGNRLS